MVWYFRAIAAMHCVILYRDAWDQKQKIASIVCMHACMYMGMYCDRGGIILLLITVSRPCVEKCPEGSFLDYNTGLCEMCSEPCLKCKGPDTSSECTSCIKGYLLVPETGSCQPECPHQYYTGNLAGIIQ